MGTSNRIKAKTAWNADSLRGDYADLLILDEFQLMDEEVWEVVGAPMLLDNNGDAVFIYTPPSLRSRSVTKARDPKHASKMYAKAVAGMAAGTGRWEAFSYASTDNPTISAEGLAEISKDMTNLAYRQEILAEDVDEAPGALWTRQLISASKIVVAPELTRVVVGVDPPGGATECGIFVVGVATVNGKPHVYLLEDRSLKASPDKWADEVLTAYAGRKADAIIAEANFGGDMVKSNIEQAAIARSLQVRVQMVQASRGKAVRAEPVVAVFEQGRAHMVGDFIRLEDEMCLWIPGETKESPNRLDAMVWAVTALVGTNSFSNWEQFLKNKTAQPVSN